MRPQAAPSPSAEISCAPSSSYEISPLSAWQGVCASSRARLPSHCQSIPLHRERKEGKAPVPGPFEQLVQCVLAMVPTAAAAAAIETAAAMEPTATAAAKTSPIAA